MSRRRSRSKAMDVSPSRRATEEAAGEDRLPPPIFPPGSTRRWRRPAPPEPTVRTPDAPADRNLDGALILPDEPLPRREPAGPSRDDLSDVVVTGIGDDAHLEPEAYARTGPAPDAELDRLIRMLGDLVQGLRANGEAALLTTPGMTRIESTLRAYCIGWLAARREEPGG